jgi:hypothetical protein
MKPTHVILVVALLLVAFASSGAQSVPSNGTPLFNSFSGGPDVINNGNLNIHFSIPVFARAGVGLPFSYSLPVDSGVWYPYGDTFGNQHWAPDFSTAQPVGVMAIGAVFYWTWQYPCYNDGDKYMVTAYFASSYTGPDNTSHSAGTSNVPTVFANSCNGTFQDHPTGTTIDGSGISITISYSGGGITAKATLANGAVITTPTIDTSGNVHGSGNFTLVDTNNNQVTVSAAANGKQINYILDTLGTKPITSSGGPPPTALKYSYTAPSGAQANVSVTYKAVTVQSAWGCTGIAEYPATSANLIDKITLPDNTYYQFFYELTPNGSGNTTGRINQVHLPTGGSINYNYTGGDTGKGIFCKDGSTAGFNRISSQSSTVQYTRTLNSSPAHTSITQIIDNSGNTTLADFYLGFESRRRVYQGAASGTPLETVITCYNGTDPIDPNACVGATVTQPFSRITTFRSLNGGPNSRDDTFYNGYGLVTKRDVYDWGPTPIPKRLKPPTTPHWVLESSITRPQS